MKIKETFISIYGHTYEWSLLIAVVNPMHTCHPRLRRCNIFSYFSKTNFDFGRLCLPRPLLPFPNFACYDAELHKEYFMSDEAENLFDISRA